MTRAEAQKIVRKATRLIIPKLQKGFGEERINECLAHGSLVGDVIKVIMTMSQSEPNPNINKYAPNTIPFDEIDEALKTLTYKTLCTGVKRGVKDSF